MNVTALRLAVAQALAEVPGLRAYAYEIDAIPAGEADVAVVSIGGPGIDYQQAFKGGMAVLHLDVELYVQGSSDRAASERMDALLSSGAGETRSVIDAIHRNRTLGGLCGGLVVDSATKPEPAGDGTNNVRRFVSTLTVRVPVGRQ